MMACLARLARCGVLGLFLGLLALRVEAMLPIEHWRTSNNVPVWFVRADTIPILDVSVLFDAGVLRDPAERIGVAGMVGRLLDHGAGELDETRLSESLAQIGADLSSGAGIDRAWVSLRTLSEPAVRERAVELMTLVIDAPRFDAEVLEREKARLIQSLAQALTRPGTIAQRRFGALLYPHHPYGEALQADDVAALDVASLRSFYEAHYVAGSAAVAMIGAIDRAQAEQIAERLAGRLPAGAPPAALPQPGAGSPGIEERIANPATQSHILMGMPAITRADPDYFALYVGNYVLGGGGFVSRLYNEVREKRGLAYSVYSSFRPRRQAGPFVVGLQTRKDQTDEALAVVRETIARFVADGPTEEELAAAKANLVGGFALRLDSNARILGELALIAGEGLDLDWLESWTDRVQSVTREAVRDAFRRRIQPDLFSTVIVGAPEAAPPAPVAAARRREAGAGIDR